MLLAVGCVGLGVRQRGLPRPSPVFSTLRACPLRLTALADGVRAGGHTSNAKHFHAMVQMKLSGLVAAKRLGRGLYICRVHGG